MKVLRRHFNSKFKNKEMIGLLLINMNMGRLKISDAFDQDEERKLVNKLLG